jgi:hypothetical protein
MHLCGVTKTIKIGCEFNIVPMWHPLRLVEDDAMASNREVFEYCVEILFKPFSHNGKYYTILPRCRIAATRSRRSHAGAGAGAASSAPSTFIAACARRAIHLELAERLALGYRFHISSSREQAIPTAVKIAVLSVRKKVFVSPRRWLMRSAIST